MKDRTTHRYFVGTLSDGHASTISKDLLDGQALPLLSVPNGGTIVFPAAIPALAAAKNGPVLHQLTWPKTSPFVPGRPLTQVIPWRPGEAFVSRPLASRSERTAPLKPNHKATTAPAGSAGTTLGAAGVLPESNTSGW